MTEVLVWIVGRTAPLRFKDVEIMEASGSRGWFVAEGLSADGRHHHIRLEGPHIVGYHIIRKPAVAE